jgi:ABC-type multidrug transport system fused ATPase/permease subunit
MAQFIPKLLYVTKGNHNSLIAMIFLFLFVSGLEVFGTGMIGPFIAIATNPESIKKSYWLNSIFNHLHFNSDQQFLTALGLIVVATFLLKSFVSFNAQKNVFEFAFGLRGQFSYKLMKAYLEAPYSYHLHVNSATLIQNIMALTDQVCSGLIMPLLTCISNAAIFLALVLLLIKTDSMALIFIAIILLVSFWLLHPLKDRLNRWGRDGYDASIQMFHIANHGLGSLKETRVFGCEPYFELQMKEQTERYAMNSSLASGYGNLPRYVIEAFMISFLVGFTLLFLNLNQGSGQNLTSVLGIFALASIRLMPAVGNLISGINLIRYNTHSLDRLFFDFKELEKKDYTITSKQSNHLVNLAISPHKQTISFIKQISIDGLTFCYSGAKRNAIEDISINIQRGQSIGLIGKSGAGKTTLVDVLLGLFTPQFGDIKVDGVSVYSDLRAWQNLLGYVPQSIFLMDDTLERNIAFGVPDHLIDRNRLMKAIEMAQLGEVVEQLPNGVQTVVGERECFCLADNVKELGLHVYFITSGKF